MGKSTGYYGIRVLTTSWFISLAITPLPIPNTHITKYHNTKYHNTEYRNTKYHNTLTPNNILTPTFALLCAIQASGGSLWR